MTGLNVQIEQTVTEQDRQWFERNPSRRYHIRGFVPGEFPMSLPGGVGCWFVIVMLLRPGHPNGRARITLRSDRVPDDTDAVLGPLVASLRERGGERLQ